MHKVLGFFLATGRKRRCLTFSVALWLLRLIRDAEQADLLRLSNRLDCIRLEENVAFLSVSLSLEDKCSECEYTLDMLDSAIEDLECTY